MTSMINQTGVILDNIMYDMVCGTWYLLLNLNCILPNELQVGTW